MLYKIDSQKTINSWYYRSDTKEIVQVNNIRLTEGLFEKGLDGHYTKEQWEKAFHNGLFLTETIEWASKNGYSGVQMPRGKTYMFCYSNYADISPNIEPTSCIHITASNFVFDLNGCRFKVMLDSTALQPYYVLDGGTAKNNWSIWGNMISFMNCRNSVVQNGELVGDIYERSFAEATTEWREEQTYGVAFLFGSSNNKISNMDIHGFMGDCVRGHCLRGVTRKGRFTTSIGQCPAGVMKRGYIDENGIIDETVKNAFYSNINKINWDDFYPKEQGYNNRGQLILIAYGKDTHIDFQGFYGDNKCAAFWPHVDNPDIEILFYDSKVSSVKPSRRVVARVQDVVYFNENEDSFRYQITRQNSYFHDVKEGKEFGEQIDSEGFPMTYSDARMCLIACNSDGNVVEHSKIHDGHRGGMSNLTRNTIVRNCELYRNGMDSGIGAPTFGDIASTRYCINCEEIQQKGILFENNKFYNNHNVFLNHAIDMTIRNNEFYNNFCILVIYNMNLNSVFEFNRVYECDRFLKIGNSYKYERVDRDWFGGVGYKQQLVIRENIIESSRNCDLKINNSEKLSCLIENNIIKINGDVSCRLDGSMQMSSDVRLVGNDIILSGDAYPIFCNCTMVNNRIEKKTKGDLTATSAELELKEGSRNNVFINMTFSVLSPASCDKHCRFYIGNDFINCKFVLLFEKPKANNVSIINQTQDLYFIDCRLKNIAMDNLYINGNNHIWFKNCNIMITDISDCGNKQYICGSPRLWDGDFWVVDGCHFDIRDSRWLGIFDSSKNYNGTQSYSGNNFTKVVNCTSYNYDLTKLFDPKDKTLKE